MSKTEEQFRGTLFLSYLQSIKDDLAKPKAPRALLLAHVEAERIAWQEASDAVAEAQVKLREYYAKRFVAG